MTPAAIRAKLVHEVTAFDAREEAKAAKNPRRHHHNVYALGIMLGRVDSVVADIACGASLPRALFDNFQGPLLAALEKAFNLPRTNGGHASAVRPE